MPWCSSVAWIGTGRQARLPRARFGGWHGLRVRFHSQPVARGHSLTAWGCSRLIAQGQTTYLSLNEKARYRPAFRRNPCSPPDRIPTEAGTRTMASGLRESPHAPMPFLGGHLRRGTPRPDGRRGGRCRSGTQLLRGLRPRAMDGGQCRLGIPRNWDWRAVVRNLLGSSARSTGPRSRA